MAIGFWEKLSRPIAVLAPMADVTDAAFRRIIARYGKPPVMWTEFVSADGLIKADEAGREKLLKDLMYTEAERPIVAQLFTGNPDVMEQAAELVLRLGFDGLDINMGCPDRSVEKQCAGAALITDPTLAVALIAAARRGVGDRIPVSLKTRLGYNKDELTEWLPVLLAAKPAVVTLHARTRKEMSSVPARWERIARAVAIRDERNSETLIFGNGDVVDLADARAKARASGADGVMLGRAIFGNPWLFTEKRPSIEERLRVMVEHTKLFEELFMHSSKGLGPIKNFAIMKKHYKAYANGFEKAKELRIALMEAKGAAEVERIVERWKASQ